MKAAVLALALLVSGVVSVQSRELLQAPAEAPSSNCPTTVFDVAEQNGLTSLLEALRLDDLQDSLDNTTLTYTVFAPTNEAFDEALTLLGRRNLQDVLFHGLLDPILQYHFVIKPYTEEELESMGAVHTNYYNQTVDVGPDGSITAFASNATITKPNLRACEAMVQIIDHVLVPDFSLSPILAPTPSASI